MTPLAPTEARARIERGVASLLDIREDYEAATARLDGAIRLPLGVLLADPERARAHTPVLVADHNGRLAAFAARYLREKGVDARAIEGGALGYLRETSRS